MEQGFLQIPLPLCRTDPLYIDCLDHPGKDIQYVYVFLQKQFPVIYQNVPDLPRFFFVTCTNPVSPARHLHQPVIGLVIFGSHGFLCKYAPECDIIHSLFDPDIEIEFQHFQILLQGTFADPQFSSPDGSVRVLPVCILFQKVLPAIR